ncbi:maleylpyruvate isomerase N-terminal domain-containing protein [Streptomyces pratensis]|uniref:maleylpyruvate isomerase N-terminal domain-containing protein n=1 Tax=Streptomyces pratensis TaxID=1169025 RepID=UPI0037A44A6E
MEVSEHLTALATEGRALAAAAREAGPEALVPSCPGRRVRDLLGHTGVVHRWATAFVVEGHRTHLPTWSVRTPDRGLLGPGTCGSRGLRVQGPARSRAWFGHGPVQLCSDQASARFSIRDSTAR